MNVSGEVEIYCQDAVLNERENRTDGQPHDCIPAALCEAQQLERAGETAQLYASSSTGEH